MDFFIKFFKIMSLMKRLTVITETINEEITFEFLIREGLINIEN